MTVSITAAQLFQPAPSGVGPYGALPLVPPAGTWLAIELQVAAIVQLPTTAWQPGGPERTILAIEAVSFAQSDANISTFAQGAFLSTAASGTVTYVAPDGTEITVYVTPDPSNAAQNPTGALGWLDVLTQNVYNTYRLQAQYAQGPLAVANVGAATPTYAVGQYHAKNSLTGATYANPSAIALPPSAIGGGGGTISAVAPGLAFTIFGTVAPHGLAVGSVVYVVLPPVTGILCFPNGTAPGSGFAVVTAVTSTTFQAQMQSSGTWTAGGTVYACSIVDMIADVAGIGSNAGPAQVTTAITQNANVYVSNALPWAGSNWESNAALASRAQLALGAASPNGPSQAYQYFAETAAQILAGQDPAFPLPPGQPPYLMTNGPVTATVFAPVATGIVNVLVASATPASAVYSANVTPGCAQNEITGVSNANPCVISCAGATGQVVGVPQTVIISGVLGTLGVVGTWTATYVSPTAFSIPVDTTLTGAYLGGGQVEGGDLGEIDALIQSMCVPDGDVAITVSAVALPITITATVAVPLAQVAAYQLAAPLQVAAQIASYAVGGNAPEFAVAFDDIVGALEEAGVTALGQASYVRGVTSLSITGGGAPVVNGGVPFPNQQYQAILASFSLSVVGV